MCVCVCVCTFVCVCHYGIDLPASKEVSRSFIKTLAYVERISMLKFAQDP